MIFRILFLYIITVNVENLGSSQIIGALLWVFRERKRLYGLGFFEIGNNQLDRVQHGQSPGTMVIQIPSQNTFQEVKRDNSLIASTSDP